MSNIKPIHFYSHRGGPNPTKVLIFFEELGIPYQSEYVEMDQLKKEPYTNVNPNGRLPSIHDPNTDIIVWESGAIIEYLLDTYDKENRLSYTSLQEKYTQSSWKHFQMSGQGPYFGQVPYFTFYHSEQVPSVLERFKTEVKRVTFVIDSHLAKTGQEYLVGDKISFADLMFIPWNSILLGGGMGPDGGLGKEFREKEWPEKYPHHHAWHQKLMERPSVKRTMEIMAKARADAGH